MERAVEGGANVEVVRAVSSGDGETTCIDIEVWERGVGITESCGTGACAAAVAVLAWGMASRTVDVRSGGGVLRCSSLRAP